jgi:ribonuclease PH
MLLEQYANVGEDLSRAMENIGTKGGADAAKERTIKNLLGGLQAEISKVFSSCILTELYPATTISFQFTIIELDSDLLQTMINCASVTLLKSTIQCRCLPVAISLLLKPLEKRHEKPPKDWIQLDPNYNQLHHAS